MGEKGNDGGQFFTPREIIRAVVRAIDPRVGEAVYDPGCGAGGFVAQSFEYMRGNLGDEATGEQLETLRERTFYGDEVPNETFPCFACVGGTGRSRPPRAARRVARGLRAV